MAQAPTARRSTAQKEIISQALRCLDHPTATEVYEAVRKQAPQVSLGTVYRNLNLMAEAGSALRISMSDEPDRFDPNTHDHHHAICDSCGRVIDTDSSIPAELISQLEQAVEGCTGVRVSQHSLYFRGLCRDCREQDG
jgi:Fur family peroxide stress response transcriptional regulator